MKKNSISSLSELSKKANNDLDWFWQSVDEDIGISWYKKYSKVLDLSNGNPWPLWFVGGKTNIFTSSVEKFSKECPNRIAYHFISEDRVQNKVTYRELEVQSNKLANGLLSLGVKKGDVVAIYMPMICEAIVAILACSKIGAIQTVIFSGYSSESLHVRLSDCKAKILIITDGFHRKGKPISQKKNVEESIKGTDLEKILVVPYKSIDSYENSDFFVNFAEFMENQSEDCSTIPMDSEDPLFILYTSGTTGKPKGVIHTHGSFSVFAGHQAAYLIDMKKNDVLFWPADIGWITGLVWNVYGLLEIGATAIIYDGAIDWPNQNRIWDLIDEFGVTIFGISPTAVRMFRANNFDPSISHKLEKIKNIPTTGEPIDNESWWWLFEKVGKKKIPIMNLSGGTEIGGAMLSVFPPMRLKPSTVGIPCPGIAVDVFDENGNPIRNEKGFLVIKSPWPCMTRGLLNDKKRYLDTYWSRFDKIWFHGDYVFVDNDGLWFMHGRVDDVINVAGHRLSTAEIEQCVNSHNKISQAASIALPDKILGEAIAIFVVLENGVESSSIEEEITQHVSSKIGKVARPKSVIQISDLPKTRTGKIMRRLLKNKLLGLPLGDLSSLENPEVMDEVSKLA